MNHTTFVHLYHNLKKHVYHNHEQSLSGANYRRQMTTRERREDCEYHHQPFVAISIDKWTDAAHRHGERLITSAIMNVHHNLKKHNITNGCLSYIPVGGGTMNDSIPV